MADLTILYLTVNRLSPSWVEYQLDCLSRAAGDSPVISISRVPMDLGVNLIQSDPPSGWNIYKQMLRGALLAKTPFVGIAEDDTLYTREHFVEHRPPMDTVCYDMSRWSVFAWDAVPMYSMRRRIGNFSMIAPREMLIEALDERMRAHPGGHPRAGEVGRHDIEGALGVTLRKAETWYCSNPIVNVCHHLGLSPAWPPGSHRRKRLGELKAYDIPYFGKAADIVARFNG